MKTHFILMNYFIASKLRVGTNVENIFALACKFPVKSMMSKFNSQISKNDTENKPQKATVPTSVNFTNTIIAQSTSVVQSRD